MPQRKLKTLPKAAVEAIFGAFAAVEPEPKGELDYLNPFTLLVAVVLSAQATDAGVNKATPALFKLADTPEKMVALGQVAIEEKIKTIGLFRTKAKNVFALSQLLVEKFGSVVPEDREALETLPGVGRKTANVVLNIAFRQPTIAVDTHLFRVANRTGMASGKTPLAVEQGLLKVIPHEDIDTGNGPSPPRWTTPRNLNTLKSRYFHWPKSWLRILGNQESFLLLPA